MFYLRELTIKPLVVNLCTLSLILYLCTFPASSDTPAPQSSSAKQVENEVPVASKEKQKNNKGYVEDIRVTLPSDILSPREGTSRICLCYFDSSLP